jgi:hypothetical protein
MDTNKLLSIVIRGLVWSFCYLYIRRLLNPENKGNINKFKADAVYGGLATMASIVLNEYLSSLTK